MAWLLIPALLLFIASFLTPFTYWPEMLNWPFFLESGWLPYRDFAMIHTPILPYLLLIFYKMFSFTPLTLHVFGTLLLCLTTFLTELFVFEETKKVRHALVAGSLFAFLALAMNGNHVWFESLLAPLLLLVFWFLLKKKFILAGLLMGLALMTKQTSAYFLPVIALYFFYFKNLKAMLVFSLATLVSVIPFLLVFHYLGILQDFWSWGVHFVFLKPFAAGKGDSYVLLPSVLQLMVLLPFVIIPLFLARKFTAVYAYLWMLSALLLALPRFDYFHLTPALVFFSLIMGMRFNLPLLCLTLICGLLIFVKNWQYSHTFLEPKNIAIANFIKTHHQNQSLFVLNDPEQVYFLTGKLPAVTPWVPQLPWYLEHYGPKLLADFQKTPPDIIVFTPYLEKAVGGLGAYKREDLLSYIKNNYYQVHKLNSGVLILEKKK